MPRHALQKGSPEAFAWAERMRLARQARGKRIRRAGRKTERQFFRKGKLKPFSGMEQRNPRRPQPKRGFHVFDTLTRKSVGFYPTFDQAWEDRYFKKVSVDRFIITDEQYTPMELNPKRTRAASMRKNPITIIGNPPQTISARVAGIVYNRVIEIRAQKTAHNKGFYRHPFETDAQILALDNGDLLIHSIDGRRLWGRS